MDIKAMTNEQICKRIDELSNILDATLYNSIEHENAYNEYMSLNSELDERYRNANMESFTAFFKEHIEGRIWEQINPEILNSYSDWHKDMFGYRPKTTCKDW